MNKRQSFFIYTAITILILILTRQNLTLDSSTMFHINFALIKSPLKLALLSVYLFIFDYASLILARNEGEELASLLISRQVYFIKRWQAFGKQFLIYLLPTLAIHLFLFDSQNLIISWVILTIFTIIWVILAGLPLYKLSEHSKNALILIALLCLRILFTI
ncbi:hypothetical protein J2Z60_000549 [Lactobacillus colini]|uniref:Uncharacterized protein n=1 Tax=Lactobacillus colini TaxID=1819254 RepID=A0ABS4MCH5_9LACO|nr:hypothetical protein [Lactobacillus colini]MBP2057385.1 hypothetical protein [Lactobacillus colini]